MNYHDDCLWFSGYKPCHFKRPCPDCPHYTPVGERIVIVSLEAMGAVLRSTCLLPPLKRRYPKAHITWVTLPMCKALLENNPYINRLITLNPSAQALLQHLEFDLLFAVDKSLEAGALAERIQAKEKFGFGLSPSGVIRPFNELAHYQYDVGLDDELKFYINQKPETQQITETMGLTWQRDPYILELTAAEKAEAAKHRHLLLHSSASGERLQGVIGYNTGCSLLFPYKKFTVERSRELIAAWRQAFPQYAVALLGGPEDQTRQAEMKAFFAEDPQVINTPTTTGLRAGFLWMDAADVVLSGCSLGMHMAIALQKQVIAWFGVSCLQEVDLYERGIRLQSEVSCSPCWKKSCTNEPKCFDQVSVERIIAATQQLLT